MLCTQFTGSPASVPPRSCNPNQRQIWPPTSSGHHVHFSLCLYCPLCPIRFQHRHQPLQTAPQSDELVHGIGRCERSRGPRYRDRQRGGCGVRGAMRRGSSGTSGGAERGQVACGAHRRPTFRACFVFYSHRFMLYVTSPLVNVVQQCPCTA
jgi:hypothetical protein